jgi:hypothetical protein
MKLVGEFANGYSAADLFLDLIDLGLGPADVLAWDAVAIRISSSIASTPHLYGFLARVDRRAASTLSHQEFLRAPHSECCA